MLVAKGIIKSYGNLKVLRGVDLSVERGQILGLMGVNGAGKTTLISILAGLTRPDAGDVHIGAWICFVTAARPPGISGSPHRRWASTRP
ncbi:Hypothetical protein PFR_JS9-2_667 [Propionibacterium freudenreichii]|nr:Hypothetical protein PFR_JS9-1_669 [Propionibacterium freudenreichii]SCQ67412.1 Hypothetical protein PFR_JS9-2_667 [Propionibacterium freudenreichii]